MQTAAADQIEQVCHMLADNSPVLLQTAKDLAKSVCKVAHMDGQSPGKLEIEASFGQLEQKTFMPTMNNLHAQMVLTALDRGETQWDRHDDEWHIYYDTYITLPDTNKVVRSRTIDGVAQGNMHKTRVARLDLCSAQQLGLGARLQCKVERELENRGMMLLQADTVRVSTRRVFEVSSRTLVGLKYRFVVLQSWSGRTTCEAERVMQESPAQQSTVEIECELNWPQPNTHTLVFAILSLLLKVQDVLEILTGQRSLQHASRINTYLDSIDGKRAQKTQKRGRKRRAH